ALPAGQYHITVGSYSVDHAISGPETFDINVDLASITVTVVDALTGAPLEEAEVSVREIGFGSKTDRNGQVTLDAPHGATAIEVDKEGYGTVIVATEPALLVKLTPSEETVVHIVDGHDGRPLSGWATARRTSAVGATPSPRSASTAA